jgi:hypothetical protein
MRDGESEARCNAGTCVAPGPPSSHPSQLFTVRLWPEELGDGQVEWRGQVRHVTSGQSRCFRQWPALVAALQDMLAACQEEPGSADET